MFENLDTYYQFQGYDTFIGPTNQGRGVGIFVRTEICADKVVMETDFQESVWCSIKLQNSDSLLIGCIYKSPNCSNENCLELFQLFGKVKDMRYSHKLIMGDFNFRDINWSDMSTSSNEQQNSTLFIESIRDSFMFQHVLEPTRYRANNEPSILDLIFSNEEGMVSDIQYNPSVGRSDHLVLSFKFICYTPNTSKNNTHSTYNFFKGDYQSIKSQLEQTNWEGEMEGLDLSSSWLWFTEQYIDLLEKFIPESKPRQKREKAGPVVTQSCLDAIKNKHRKWLKYKYCKSPVNFNQYKIARNAVTLELRSAKYAYEKDLATRIKTDNKLFWNYVSKNSKTKKSVCQLLSSDGTLTCAPLVADLFLYCYERDFMDSLNHDNQADVIEAFNSTSRYLDDLLNIDNPYFEGMVNQIYPPELQLNKANISDTEAPFLDLSVANGFVSSKIYDKRDDFDFDIVNFPFLDGDVPRRASYGVYISQLIRFARVCNHVTDFNARNKCLTAKLLQQGYRYHKLRKTFSKFYRRHYELISKYNVGLKTLLREGLSEPEFYGDLVYKFKKLKGINDFSFQFRKIITRYRRIGYNLNVMRQSACLVFNPIMVDNYAAFFNCTPVGRASDSMMAPT